MLVILKIPVAYLCAVVWWAIKAEPEPLEGAGVAASLEPDPETGSSGCDWRRRPAHAIRPRRPCLPRGGNRRVAFARAKIARMPR